MNQFFESFRLNRENIFRFFSFKMLSEFNSDEKNQRQCPGETCMSVCAVWRGEAEGHMCTPPPPESSFLAMYLAVTLQILWPL